MLLLTYILQYSVTVHMSKSIKDKEVDYQQPPGWDPYMKTNANDEQLTVDEL